VTTVIGFMHVNYYLLDLLCEWWQIMFPYDPLHADDEFFEFLQVNQFVVVLCVDDMPRFTVGIGLINAVQ
jgi:hypothetical protein